MTLVIDWLWFMVEIPATLSVVGLVGLLPIILGSGAICFLIVFLIQRFVSRDDWGASIVKGIAMGVTAGVPYPVVGTMLGTALLSWAGISQIKRIGREMRRRKK